MNSTVYPLSKFKSFCRSLFTHYRIL